MFWDKILIGSESSVRLKSPLNVTGKFFGLSSFIFFKINSEDFTLARFPM